jgi:hypothetical protein
MPPGALLTFTEYPDGGKLERGPATSGEMLREAMGPPVAFLFLGFCSASAYGNRCGCGGARGRPCSPWP